MPPDSIAPTPGRVVLLHDAHASGARVDTSDVLEEAAHVGAALRRLGYEACTLPVGLDLAAALRSLERLAPAVVFNLVEALAGRAELIHFVPGVLETSAIPFTGCPADAQYSTSNKLLAKRQLKQAMIATPEAWAPGLSEIGPWIAKSVWEHASFGIDDGSVVARSADVPGALGARRGKWGGEWFAERFIPGRELNVALLATPEGVRTLPVAEILFDGFPADKPRIVGYAAKWNDGSFEYGHTPRTFDVEPELARRVAEIARACWQLFGLGGYARVDFRVDPHGGLWVLEVNSNPCLSPDAGFAAALAEGGIAFDDAVSWLLEDALRRAAPKRLHVQHT